MTNEYTNTNESAKIGAIKVELIQNAYTTNSGEEVPERVVFTAACPRGCNITSVVDYGHYWDFGCDDQLFLKGEGGEEINDDVSFLADRMGGNVGDKWDELERLIRKVGDWAECECRSEYFYGSGHKDGKLRITALAELPRISVEKTIKDSELTEKQMSVIRIYGEPLFAEGGVIADNGVWMPSISAEVREIVKKHIAGRFADLSVEVKDFWTAEEPDCIGLDGIRIRVSAKSEEALREGLAKGGVKHADKIRIAAVEGYGEDVTAVYADIRLNTSL